MSSEERPKAAEKVLEIIDQMDVAEPEKTLAKAVTLMGGNPTALLIAGAYRQMTAEAERKYPKQPIPEDYSEVERVIHEMLVENTGAHPLDSGALYGRHWERNRQVRDFRDTPEVYVGEDTISINVFHYLSYYLERDEVAEELERELYEFAERPENRSKPWIDVMVDFARRVRRKLGRGWVVHPPFNSYNWENFLSQVMQGVVIENEDEGYGYVILQIHNGCDVRGGYTEPRVFRVEDVEEFFFNMDEVWVGCDCESGTIVAGWGYEGGEWPEHWVWDEERRMYVCRRCGKPLSFSIPE